MSKTYTVSPSTRTAIVNGGLCVSLKLVQDYLPSNYTAEEADGVITITGVDDHGWSLHEYVIPRLRSGMIAVTEVVIRADGQPVRLLHNGDEQLLDAGELGSHSALLRLTRRLRDNDTKHLDALIQGLKDNDTKHLDERCEVCDSRAGDIDDMLHHHDGQQLCTPCAEEALYS